MSQKPSEVVFLRSVEGQNKFEYFVTGVAGALFAYIAQTYTPKALEWGPQSLEPLSLLLLSLAFFFGLKRIEATVEISRLNFEMLDSNEKAGNMAEAILKGHGNGYNVYTGDPMRYAELPQKRAEYRAQGVQAEIDLLGMVAKSAHYYSYRKIFLFGGFAAIFLAKILSPYMNH